MICHLSITRHTNEERFASIFLSLENFFLKNKLLMHEIIQSFDDDDDNCQCVQDVRYISFVNFSYPHTQLSINRLSFGLDFCRRCCLLLFSLKSKSYYKFEPQLIMERIIIINVFFFASFFHKIIHHNHFGGKRFSKKKKNKVHYPIKQ